MIDTKVADSSQWTSEPKAYTLPVKPKLIPRPYQQEAISYLRGKKRALLTDAPGLGKTLIASEAATTPCLIAAPSYLCWQWYDFLTDQYPDSKVVLCSSGNRKERQAALRQVADWYIITLDMMRAPTTQIINKWGMDVTGPRTLTFEFPNVTTIIIDEAHHMRGRDSQRSKGAELVCARAERVYMLTATPIYKAPDDLYQLLRILDSATFTSYHNFVSEHCRMWASPHGNQILGASNSGKLRKVLDQYALGRTYEDVGAQLPEIIKKVVAVRPTEDFMVKYREVRDKYINIFQGDDVNILSLMECMHLLRRLTAVAKLKPMAELLEDEGEGIIFTNYTQSARALAEMLHIPCVTGELTPEERKTISKDSRLVVASIDSMSEGVDLSHLNHVLFFEENYVAAKMYQALSRVRRMRVSPAPVRVTHLYVKGTVDEVIHNVVGQRNATIKEIMRVSLLGD